MTTEETETKKIEGIGGWLLLPTISLFARVFVYGILVIFLLFTGLDIYSFVIILIFMGMIWLISHTLFLEFRKDKTFPKWIIRVFWIELILLILFSIITEDYTGIFGMFIFLTIWRSYFEKSKRVKNTFIK